MADVSLSTGDAFTDPLGASDPVGTRRRIRRAHALILITVAIVGGVVVAFVDALKRGLGELVDRLHVLAREDPLTGALNRRACVEQVDHEIARAGRGGHSCAVAIVDVDHFKDINDSYGHAAGDAALRRLVATVSRRLRRGDALGRLGGEEFGVLLAARTAPAPRPMRRSCARSSPPTPPAAAGPTRSAWESPCCRIRARARRASSTPPTARCTAPSARAATPSAPPDAGAAPRRRRRSSSSFPHRAQTRRSTRELPCLPARAPSGRLARVTPTPARRPHDAPGGR